MTEAPKDPLLFAMVHAINQARAPNTGWSMTLMTDGMVVTGDLVPAWVWFKKTQDLLAAAGGGSVALSQLFGNLGDDVLGDLLLREGLSESAPVGECRIHVRSLTYSGLTSPHPRRIAVAI